MIVEIFGENKEPYSSNTFGAPPEIVAAVKQGFGQSLGDFDFRENTWLRENALDTAIPAV